MIMPAKLAANTVEFIGAKLRLGQRERAAQVNAARIWRDRRAADWIGLDWTEGTQWNGTALAGIPLDGGSPAPVCFGSYFGLICPLMLPGRRRRQAAPAKTGSTKRERERARLM